MIRPVLLTALLSIALVTADCLAAHNPGHQHGAAQTASKHADVRQHADCKHCGMNREAFSSSRMLVTYNDGTSVGTCSIACLATELKAGKDKKVKSVQVGDYDRRTLIDAKKATWVIGGDQPGVMAPVATWAFGDKAAAQTFVKRHGGRLASYKEALAQVEKQ